jgi:hypothetical protein
MKYLLSHFLLFILLIIVSLALFSLYGKNIWQPFIQKYCVTQQNIQVINKQPCEPCPLTHVGPLRMQKECPVLPPQEILTSEQKLKRHLADSDFIIYPKTLTLIVLKHERKLEVWGRLNNEQKHIATYPFTAFSGILGPKLREGDRQIPEGIYGISFLNPKSKFHLAMRVNYPNEFDKKMAKQEKRTKLGGDIMIHGSNRTIGCVPIGDDKIEELYFLANKVGIKNIKVIFAPVDFRVMNVNIKTNKHPWLKDLYAKIKKEMEPFISK